MRADAPATVAEFFSLIEQQSVDADSVDVTFDPELGYPTLIWIDTGFDVYDDEWGFEIVIAVGCC